MNIKRNATFSELLSSHFEFIRDVEVLLEVDFPIIFSFSAADKQYLAYVTEFKRRKKSLNVLYVETDYETLLELVSQNISVKDALLKKSGGLLSKKESLLENELDLNASTLISLLPKDTFYLSELLPNQVDIIEKKNQFFEINKLLNTFRTFKISKKSYQKTSVFFNKSELLQRFESLMVDKDYMTKNTKFTKNNHVTNHVINRKVYEEIRSLTFSDVRSKK